ncbi:FeoC-like transcriptional regulator [Enemella sp. A6]|uniref:FeoC-like transcriptional regulator n=1 Tax=Enemella sp. A6 TaxID=3440152 RepID=UPI003EB74379
MSGPLHQVLGALNSGCRSLAEVADRTGLAIDTVRTATDHLVRMGRIETRELAMGCSSGGCSSCPSSSGCGAGPTGGPVLLTLSRRT